MQRADKVQIPLTCSDPNPPAAGGREMRVHMLRGGVSEPQGPEKHAMQRLRTSEIPQDGQLSITGREDVQAELMYMVVHPD